MYDFQSCKILQTQGLGNSTGPIAFGIGKLHMGKEPIGSLIWATIVPATCCLMDKLKVTKCPLCIFHNTSLIHFILHISMVSCQKDPTQHAYAWQIGPFWQDTIDFLSTNFRWCAACWVFKKNSKILLLSPLCIKTDLDFLGLEVFLLHQGLVIHGDMWSSLTYISIEEIIKNGNIFACLATRLLKVMLRWC